MNKTLNLFFTIVLGVISTLAQASEKPNILFILSDDMRWDSFGYMDKFDLQTPNLDQLAQKSVHFTRSYNTTAICMGSRAQYSSGLYEFSTGTNFAHGSMSPDLWQQTYHHVLKQNGYYTGMLGKLGFHVLETSGKKGNADMVRPSFDYWGAWLGQGKYEITENPDADAWFENFGGKEEHTTHALGLMAEDFLQKAAAQDKPFVLQVSFKAPHGPYAVDPRYKHIYANAEFPKPEDYGLDPNAPKQALSGRPQRLGEAWLSNYDKQMAGYHGLVYGMDMAVGRILDMLEEQGLADNTIVIFAGDNGHQNGSKGYSGKLYAYDASTRSPTFIYDPRSPVSGDFNTSTVLTGNIDIAPTILDYAGVDAPEKVQGKSLAPIMATIEAGKTPKDTALHDSLLLISVWGTPSAQSLGVVTPEAKYIHWFYGGMKGFDRAEELFLINLDPLESHSVTQDAASAELLEELRAKYDQWMVRWEEEGWEAPETFDKKSKDHGYRKYVRLADRNTPFENNDPAELADMWGGSGDGTLNKKKKNKKNKSKETEK
ncbi:MAG: sulfatase-like hydrolase/transferase [Pseudomonadales bacterium]